jgi:hypothetical protein
MAKHLSGYDGECRDEFISLDDQSHVARPRVPPPGPRFAADISNGSAQIDGVDRAPLFNTATCLLAKLCQSKSFVDYLHDFQRIVGLKNTM